METCGEKVANVSEMHLQVDLLMRERSYLAAYKNKQLKSTHKTTHAICTAQL